MTATSSAPPSAKADDAFRTIGELAGELGVPQHILRYWETRFLQLRPLQRAGKRRYYRPADVVLVRRIDRLLNHEGYTIRGVQKLLDSRAPDAPAPDAPPPDASADTAFASLPAPAAAPVATAPEPAGDLLPRLAAIRRALAEALAADA